MKEERLDTAQTTGFTLAYIGVLIIVTRLDLAVIRAFDYNRGDVLLLLGTLCFGLYNVLLRKFRFSFTSQNTKLFYIFLYGSLPLLAWVWPGCAKCATELGAGCARLAGTGRAGAGGFGAGVCVFQSGH